MKNKKELKETLEVLSDRFNVPGFIENDPISIPHGFLNKEDIEISGFLTALLSWGQRPVILRNCQLLMERMDFAPHDFIIHHQAAERKRFGNFVHRTFNGIDATYMLKALQKIYNEFGGLEGLFTDGYRQSEDLTYGISWAREIFLSFGCPERTVKHFADPMKNSAAKRINMFLRWMVRSDNKGVDFGLWNSIPMSALFCPLDLHSGRVARDLKILNRQQDDWKAVAELTANLKVLNPVDPVKYDFALYGLGIHERYNS